jgi:hypothetical protein
MLELMQQEQKRSEEKCMWWYSLITHTLFCCYLFLSCC